MVFYSIIQTVILPWEWPRVTSGTLRLLPPRRTRCGRSPLLADSGTKGEQNASVMFSTARNVCEFPGLILIGSLCFLCFKKRK